MKRPLKQVLGIDVAQKELVVSLGRMTEDLQTELYAHKVFSNTPKGCAALLQWTQKHTDATVLLQFVMEATGVYHEALAYHLTDRQQSVAIVLPSKISNYVRTLEVKTITDKTASQAIARFGLERSLKPWQPPSPTYKRLRQLTREREQVVQERTAVKNQLHAEKAEAQPHPKTLERLKTRMALLSAQEKEIRRDIEALTRRDPGVHHTIEQLCSIPGVGELTACSVLSETNGFTLIQNKRQLTSYAGLDVKEKQSGTSVRAKPRISKKGNKYLRKALHLPALTALRYESPFRELYNRLVQKHGIKMKAVVAVQRKLLELMYTLYKTNTTYDKGYHQHQLPKPKNPAAA